MNIFKSKELKEILLERNSINYKQRQPTLKKYKTGDIIDEEKSVRWNKEEVERLKKVYIDECNRLSKEKNELLSKNNVRLYNFIKSIYKLNDSQIKQLKEYIEQIKKNSNICYIDDEVNLYINLFHLLDNILPKSKLVKEENDG